MKMKHSMFLLFAVACATHSIKEATHPPVKTVDEILNPKPISGTTVNLEPISVITSSPQPKVWKTPRFTLHVVGKDLTTYHTAINHLQKYANTDEFYSYVSKKRKYFAHAPCKVEECIKTFREQLDRGDQIDIYFYTPFWKSNVIGGWNGSNIKENTKFVLNDIERAGHLLHETSHKYGWTHQGNYSTRNDNINSFPYAIGTDLEEFIAMKVKNVAAQ